MQQKNRWPWLSLAGTKIVLDLECSECPCSGIWMLSEDSDSVLKKPGAVTGPKGTSCCAGPLMGATVLVAVLGPARSSCAQKKKCSGIMTKNMLGLKTSP